MYNWMSLSKLCKPYLLAMHSEEVYQTINAHPLSVCHTCLSELSHHSSMQAFLLDHTEPSLKALLNELHPLRASWFKIGLQLDIPHTELICFRKMHSDFSDSLCEMLVLWLKTAVDPPPTWEAVVTALRSPSVNEMNIAGQLELKYCKPAQHVMEESSKPTSVETSEGTTYLTRKCRTLWGRA